MKAVWKYPLPVTDEPVVRLPEGHEILAIGEQFGELFLWALVDVNAPAQDTKFRVVGTGHQLNGSEGKHVGSAVCHGGQLVWHVFEYLPAENMKESDYV